MHQEQTRMCCVRLALPSPRPLHAPSSSGPLCLCSYEHLFSRVESLAFLLLTGCLWMSPFGDATPVAEATPALEEAEESAPADEAGAGG
jgi:hypothetical protein